MRSAKFSAKAAAPDGPNPPFSVEATDSPIPSCARALPQPVRRRLESVLELEMAMTAAPALDLALPATSEWELELD